MDCLDTTKSLKINLKRNIGTVLIIVEGAVDEFELLKHIFRDILHYNYIEKSRNQKNLKKYVKNHDYNISELNKHSLLNAIAMMHKVFLELGVNHYNLDDFSKTSLKLFNEQEKIMQNKKYYYLLSLISLILLDLNIITPRQI